MKINISGSAPNTNVWMMAETDAERLQIEKLKRQAASLNADVLPRIDEDVMVIRLENKASK